MTVGPAGLALVDFATATAWAPTPCAIVAWAVGTSPRAEFVAGSSIDMARAGTPIVFRARP